MPEAVMTLRYEGPAVESGAMDVRQLAPALIAAADAMREAHALLETPGPTPQVDVRAVRPGSFLVELLVADPSLYQQAMDLLASKPAVAATDLVTLVTAVVAGVAGVKKLNNRRISHIEVEEARPEVTRLILLDGTVVEIPVSSFRLVTDEGFRSALNGMVKPLAGSSGISSMTLQAGDQSETVTVPDLSAFDVPPSRAEDLGVSDTDVVLRPISVSFTEGNKWRFSDGDATYFATIEDAGFLQRVNLGVERFGKNDMLRVHLRARQIRDGLALRTERTVLEVLEHLPGAVQLDLFADPPAEANEPPGNLPPG